MPKLYFFPFSDHDGVTLQLKLYQADRSPGIWKMNCNVIENPLCKNDFETFWKSWKHNINNRDMFTNKREFWDMTKVKIKNLTIDISKNLKRKNRNLNSGKKS